MSQAGSVVNFPKESKECESSKPTSAEVAVHGHKIFFELLSHHQVLIIQNSDKKYAFKP